MTPVSACCIERWRSAGHAAVLYTHLALCSNTVSSPFTIFAAIMLRLPKSSGATMNTQRFQRICTPILATLPGVRNSLQRFHLLLLKPA